jgi:hypothetical protein
MTVSTPTILPAVADEAKQLLRIVGDQRHPQAQHHWPWVTGRPETLLVRTTRISETPKKTLPMWNASELCVATSNKAHLAASKY